MEIIYIILVILLGAIVYGIYQGLSMRLTTKRNTDIFRRVINSLENFTTDFSYIGKDGENALAIDLTNNKIALIEFSEENVYNYKDLLEVEILEDGLSITKTARGSQIAGALIGGLALGGVGAIIGGLSGSKHNIDKVSRLDLKLIVNNVETPLFLLNFLNTNYTNEYTKNDTEYINAMNSIQELHSRLSVLIKKADENDLLVDEKENQFEKNTNLSIADEIRKLKSLKDDGLINEDEYLTQKEKLLNS